MSERIEVTHDQMTLAALVSRPPLARLTPAWTQSRAMLPELAARGLFGSLHGHASR